MVREEGIRQGNIECVVRRALPDAKPEAHPENIDADWLTHFFERCRIVSDDQMQSLWGRVLAGEANAPGSFCKRTLETVATLEKSEAELFTRLCRFCWTFADGEPVPLIYDIAGPIYLSQGISFDSLNHLCSIGLLTFDGMSMYGKRGLRQETVACYFKTAIVLSLPNIDDTNQVQLGYALLTKTGIELAPISGAAPLDDFREQIMSRWRDQQMLKA